MQKKKSRGIRILSMIISAVLLTGSFELSAKAGVITKENGLVNQDGELNVTDWYDPNDNLEITDGELVIPNDSSSETRIISKAFAVADDSFDEMINVTGNIFFTQLSEGEKFILAFGLSNVEAYSGEPGNVEIEFSSAGDIRAAVTVYDENGDANTVAEAKSCGVRTGQRMTVKASLTTSGKLLLTVNGKKIFHEKLPVLGEGRVGFLQTGSCGARISNLTASFTNYERPENVDFFEDFEEGYYNNNLFSTNHQQSARDPAYIAVEEYSGSKVLMFKNTGLCYFGIKYPYSNFELTFDIPYISRETVKDEAGKIMTVPCGGFCVSFGDVAADFKGWAFSDSTELIHFTTKDVFGYNHDPRKFDFPYAEKGVSDSSTNEGCSVRIRVVDGKLTLGLKRLGEKNFKTAAEAVYDNFRTGYVKFWTTNDGSVAIDNIKMKNLDTNPNLTEAEFESALLEVEDYDYQPAELVFRPGTAGEEVEAKPEKVFHWEMLIVYTAAGCVVVLAACTAVAVLRKKQRGKKEEQSDEIR